VGKQRSKKSKSKHKKRRLTRRQEFLEEQRKPWQTPRNKAISSGG